MFISQFVQVKNVLDICIVADGANTKRRRHTNTYEPETITWKQPDGYGQKAARR